MSIGLRGKFTAVAALAGTVLVSACGSSSNSSANTGGGGGADLVAQAKSLLAGYEKTTGVTFTKPNQTFNPGVHKVAIIACGNAGVGCQQMSAFAQQAAAAIGWQASPTFDGQFDPNKQSQYIEQALNQGYDAIILASIDAASISSAINDAAAKHVPIACIMCENPTFTGKVMDTTTMGKPGGEALAAFIAATLGGKGNVFGFDDKSFPIVGTRMIGLKDGLSKLCPACNYTQLQFPTTDLSKPGPPTWTGFLSAHPKGTVDFVAGPYDFMVQPAAKTAHEEGRDEIKLSGFDAWATWTAEIAAGSPPGAAATIAAPFEYCSWAAMDEVARAVTGTPTWDATHLPVVVVDSTNASQFSQGYFKTDFDTPSFFKQQWGKA